MEIAKALNHTLDHIRARLAQLARENEPAALAELEQLRGLYEDLLAVADRHSVAAVRTALKLVPLAQAKGEAKRELIDAMERYDRGLRSNFAVKIDPGKRFPVEVINTGSLDPLTRQLPQPGRADDEAEEGHRRVS